MIKCSKRQMPRYSPLEIAEYDEYARWCERGDREESS
jgi:hypothetical protein